MYRLVGGPIAHALRNFVHLKEHLEQREYDKREYAAGHLHMTRHQFGLHPLGGAHLDDGAKDDMFDDLLEQQTDSDRDSSSNSRVSRPSKGPSLSNSFSKLGG